MPAPDDDQVTEELRLEQVQRFRRERQQAELADDGTQAQQHDRRAERAEYLAGKLEQRAESERER